MNTMACRAVTQAGLSAATASLDDEVAWPLLLVAGWLTTAADLMREAVLAEALPACRALGPQPAVPRAGVAGPGTSLGRRRRRCRRERSGPRRRRSGVRRRRAD